MDVDAAAVPPAYEPFRRRLRRVVEEHTPSLASPPRMGMRVPEDAEEVAVLRRWVRALHDAGCTAPRPGVGTTDGSRPWTPALNCMPEIEHIVASVATQSR